MASQTNVFVRWASTPSGPGPLTARIYAADPSGIPVRGIAWTCLYNGVRFITGGGPEVSLRVVQPGVYRVQATVLNAQGETVTADSSVTVSGAPTVQASTWPVQPGPTLQYLGEIYSPQITVEAQTATYLPYEVSAISAVSYLFPGTDFVRAELEGAVDDEVVLRTQTGNWALIGPPNGLNGEELPYDYRYERPYLPVPLDLKLRYSLEVWNVQGMSVGAQNFRVKFKCYRAAAPLFRYTPCDWSAYPGGTGERQRRLIALFTQVDVEGDADLHLGRTASGSYYLPDLMEIRACLETERGRDQVFQDDRFFTQQSLLATYEAEELPDLQVHGVYGLAGIRPSYQDFGQKGYPRPVQKVKRVYGKLLVFVAGGGFSEGTTIDVRLRTGALPGYRTFTVPVLKNVYSSDYERYVKVGELAADVSDFEFSRLGLVFDFSVNESGATGTVAPSCYPLPLPAGEDIYSTVNAPAVMVDGACFSRVEPVMVHAGTWAATGSELTGCNRIECGPLGYYCYTELAGTGTLFTYQPLGFPAPYVALQSDQARCYGNPAYFYEVYSNGTHAPVLAYTGTTGCGVGYVYTPCQAGGGTLAVIYPLETVPHNFVAHGSRCYAYSGSVADLRPYTTLLASSVSAVADCLDYACTGSNASGPSVLYRDLATNTDVAVNFPQTHLGIARWGAISESNDPGYGATLPATVHVTVSPKQAAFPFFTAIENATVSFRVEPSATARMLDVVRGNMTTHYPLRPGLLKLDLNLQAGDRVALAFTGKHYAGPATIRYEKKIQLPRLYHTAVVAQADASRIVALGFCGFGDRGDYAFFGTLPAFVEQTVCNPDSRVTVQGTNTPELLLIETRGPGEPLAYSSLARYTGQSIAGPMTFRFYADRTAAGKHGEMDLWLDTDQAWPQYLAPGPYQVLVYGTYSYRRDAQYGDTRRRSVRVITDPAGYAYPGVYVSATGERIAVAGTTASPVYRGTDVFAFTGTFDVGLSEHILRLSGDAPPTWWLSSDGDLWLDSVGSPWTI